MDDLIEYVFIGSILEETLAAHNAGKRLTNYFEENFQPGKWVRADHRNFFRISTEFFQHVAMVSKFLWPVGEKNSKSNAQRRAKARGEHLRKVLGIPQNHALSGRDLRNALEHFDEKLDDWAAMPQPNILVLNSVGQPRAVIGSPTPTPHIYLRHFDPTTGVFIFDQKDYRVQELVDGIKEIYPKVQARYDELKQRKINRISNSFL